jgi:ABC-type transport system substrate-binding protein
VVTAPFLTQMTGLPDAQSEVDTSDTLLQLDMASSPETTLSPDVRVAVALLINRQDLVNQEVSWALPGIEVADSHVNIQGQPAYKPASTGTPTTTIPTPTSSTSTTVIGAGGSVNFPVTPVPTQADALLTADGLVRAPGDPYYHYEFGVPYTLRMVMDMADPWAAQAASVIRNELVAAGLDTTLSEEPSAAAAGQALANGSADMALMPEEFTPYLSQTLAWYTTLLGPPGRNGSEDWTGYSNTQFDQTVTTASKQLNADTAATSYAQADTQLWDEMVSLPLYPEPGALVWSRKIGGVTPTPRSDSLLWYAQYWAVRAPESTSNTTPSLPGP